MREYAFLLRSLSMHGSEIRMRASILSAQEGGEIRTVTAGQLVQSAKMLGSRYIFENAQPDEDDALLHGHFNTLQLRPGLILHAAQVQDLCDMDSVNVLYPGLKIVAVVGGHTDVSYGPHRFLLGPGSPVREMRCRGVIVNLADTANFSRRWQCRREEKKISITLGSEWLTQGTFSSGAEEARLQAFMQCHLATQEWQLSARASQLIREILQPVSFQPGLARLLLEGRCLELVAEALGFLQENADSGASLGRLEKIRLARLEELLRTEEAMHLSCDEIAGRVGTNPTSLQQLARQAWGCSVFEYLRTLRMEKSLAAIRAGCSVADASEIAGYASATNFATAFKRRYGLSPREARA